MSSATAPRPAPARKGRAISLEDRSAEIASAACAVAVDDHLLVAECGSGDVRLFNPTAAFIWRRLEERLSEASIAQAVARDFGVDYRIAHADVAATLEAWIAAGLATFEGGLRHAPSPAGAVEEIFSRETEHRRYRLGDARFSVRYRLAANAGDRQHRFHERVMALLAPLEDAVRGRGPEIELAIDRTHATAYGPFCRRIVGSLFGPFEWLFTLHASVLAPASRAIALCAPQGGGKSTLAAYLAARGWRYFNDDLAIVDPRGPAVLPLPVALGVKPGARGMLESDYPALRRAPVHRYGRKAVRYVAVRRSAMGTEPAPLAAIVFSRYEAGAALTMRSVAPAQAARAVMEAGIVFSPALRHEMVDWMGRLLQDIPCLQLRYSNLSEAEAALRTVS